MEIKKNYDVRKSGKVQQAKWFMQKIHFYDEDHVHQASELEPMLSRNRVVHAENTFSYQDYVCQVSKLQHICVIGLILLSALRTTKYTRLYSASHYSTRVQEVKESMA